MWSIITCPNPIEAIATTGVGTCAARAFSRRAREARAGVGPGLPCVKGRGAAARPGSAGSMPDMPDMPRTPQTMSAEHDWSSLFEFLPIGAYRNRPDGSQLRANPALVRLNGFATESEHLAADSQPNRPWYADPGRRAQFRALLARDGVVTGFGA